MPQRPSQSTTDAVGGDPRGGESPGGPLNGVTPLAAVPPERPVGVNVARRLDQVAAENPEGVAIVVPVRRRGGKHGLQRWTFAQLSHDSTAIALGLAQLGVQPGTRLALLVRPGFDFVSLVFALLKAGAVSILIDPGMGRRRVLRCLDEVEPQGFVAIPIAQAIRAVLRRRYPLAQMNITVGRRLWGGSKTLADVRAGGEEALQRGAAPKYAAGGDDPASIIFTTGSTGPPKGVLYRQVQFDRQVEEIRDAYGIRPGEIDVSCFPLFALFNSAMGVTTVFPRMDFSRPAQASPAHIVALANELEATQSFASPAVWRNIARWCDAGRQSIHHGAATASSGNRRLLTLRRVLSAGAPVAAEILGSMRNFLPEGATLHTPYGATEALPVASIEAAEVLGETSARTNQGAGVCVGRRFPGIRWKVIRIVDGPIATLDDAEELPPHAIGELIVYGDVVTQAYVNLPDANRRGKIAPGSAAATDGLAEGESEPSGEQPASAGQRVRQRERERVWHRMGDVGYLDGPADDPEARFWFCGRLAHRVTTPQGPLFTIPCEAIFNCHPAVTRTALVGVGTPGRQRPVLVVQPQSGYYPRTAAAQRELIHQLQAMGAEHEITAGIDTFLLHGQFPVDIRHNAKIFREKLAVWAAKKLDVR